MFKLLLLLAFVLLLNAPSPVDSKKVANVLKNAGKRYADWAAFNDVLVPQRKLRPNDFKYADMNGEGRNASRWENGRLLWRHIAASSSTENPQYKDAIYWLSEVTNENMTADICGDPKKYNFFQWIKHMKQQATQYKKVDLDTPPRYIIQNTVPSVLHVIMAIDLIGKNDVKAQMHFGITMTRSEHNHFYNASIFSISYVKMGGTCMEHGELKPLEDENDPQRYLKDYPSGLHLLNIFAPKLLRYASKTQESDIDLHHLPMAWLSGITFDAKITVPQDGSEEPVVYKKDEFIRWYERFSMMWHPAKGIENWLTKQEASYNEGVLVGRVSMKLQIGTKGDAPIHEWQFKVTGVNDGPVFQLINIAVLSPLTLKNVMNEQYLVYRDVIGSAFNRYMTNAQIWYPATNFIMSFRKHNEAVALASCGATQTDLTQDVPKQFWVADRYWNATMIGYLIKKELKEAKEETSVELRMKMQPPSEPQVPGHIFGSDWEFFLKWDKMDQFYYIHKVELSCPEYMEPVEGEFKYFNTCAFLVCDSWEDRYNADDGPKAK